MIVHNRDAQLTSQSKPRFLWWRFGFMALVLSLLGVGFAAAWYCAPPPSISQQAVFFFILVLILIQTVQAGWYRNDDPWEVSFAETILMGIVFGFFALIGVAIVLLLLLVDDLKLTFFLGMILVMYVAIVIWLFKNED